METQTRIGIAAITRIAFEGQSLAPLSARLLVENHNAPELAAPLMDMSIIEQLKGNLQAGLDYQLQALAKCRLYRTDREKKGRFKLLVFAAPIHMGGNTPVEFLLGNSDFEITTYFVVPGMPAENEVPDHDVAFIAAPGDSGPTLPFIKHIQKMTENWQAPVVNNPAGILKLERDTLLDAAGDIPGLRLPKTVRHDREAMIKLAETSEKTWCKNLVDGPPFVIRPVGSHAGRGLEKLETREQLTAYLAVWPDEAFFISEFVDYASKYDGRFRKYRVILVDGKPWPCHMAISDQWKIWYMNADMAKNAGYRAEEEAFMAQFENRFAKRHSKGLAELHNRIGLEYFGIDCAEDREGNLVLFEADNALIVHDMDDETIFPYKKHHMQNLFDAFASMLQDKISIGKRPARSLDLQLAFQAHNPEHLYRNLDTF